VSVPQFPDPETTFRRRVVIPPPNALVVSVPHAGTAITGFEGSLAPTLDVRGDADLFVDQLYDVVPPASASDAGRDDERGPLEHGLRLGRSIPHVTALLSRFVCDMNRDPDDVSGAAVPQHPAPRNADGRGFVWAMTTTGTPALARPLTLGEWRARQAVHAAYHRAIAEALARAKDRFGFAVLLDGHSMPSVGRSGHKDPGRARADIVPGDRDGTSCSPALSEIVQTHFKSNGYSVDFNNPYKGGFITAHHGRPADGVHAIQIEARRDLYMDEVTFTPRPEGFARLSNTLQELLAALTRWRP
jgi:N-formylglutamate amidohydrolase